MVSTRKQAARSPSPPLAFKQGDAATAVAHAPSNAAVAAPGGKATAIAGAADHEGPFVVAADLSVHRSRLVSANIERLGATAAAITADGTHPPFTDGSFDRVLLDAPCSGLGALRRRPDSRWRITAADITELAALQRTLLASSAALVRPGGTLVYSVCTLTAEESIDHPVPPGFSVVDVRPEGMWRPRWRPGWVCCRRIASDRGWCWG
jgi:16S rRNA (cytosine967-C5)-methyltransferase